MAWLTVLGASEEQVEYRLSDQCGCDQTASPGHEHDDAVLDYRLEHADRPITRIGSGWAEFGHAPGQALRDEADLDTVRAVMAGADPHSGEQLVKAKRAVDPRAKLAAGPVVYAVQAIAEAAHTTPQALLAARERPAARYARLVRGLARDGQGHQAPVKDLAAIASATGFELDLVYEAQELATAREHADAKVRIGNRGYDLVLNVPKSVSVLYGLADAETAARVEELYLQAVRETVAGVEQWCGYGVRGHHGDGRTAERVSSSGLIASLTLHRAARPVDGQAGDPHIHAHVMIANLVRCADGQWRTLASGGRDLHRHVQAAGELVKARVRELLTQEWGVAWQRCSHSGEWEIVGINSRVRQVYSRRGAQVLEAAGEGASAALQRAQARKSAHAKQDIDALDLRQAWAQRAVAAGIDRVRLIREALGDGGTGTGVATGGPGPEPGGPEQDAVATGVDTAVADRVATRVWDPESGVTAKAKVTTRAKVMAAVADACPGGVASAGQLVSLTDQVLAHPLAVRLSNSGHAASHLSHAERYTSADLVAAERLIVDAATHRLAVGAARVPEDLAHRELRVWQGQRGFQLSDEQRRVVVRLLTGGHGLDMVQGVAGAGKTTIMSAARSVWQVAGLRVEGAAVAAVAAQGLRAEAGINARTVASWTQRIRSGPGLAGVDVLVLDEAAMIGDRDLATLVAEAGRTGTKLVGIGDERQLRSIDAGGAFARVHELVGGEELTENRRQRTQVDREALELWRQGARQSALALWAEHGLVHAPTDVEGAYEQMAAAWWADRAVHTDPHAGIEKVLMLASTNRDVHHLNTTARAIARTQGLLTSEDVLFHVRGGDRLALAVGDQVRMRHNDYRSHRDPGAADVLNGHRGVVIDVDPLFGARMEWRHHGQVNRAWIDPAQIGQGALVHAYAITIAAAQGLTADRSHVLGLGADVHSLYAALSRARDQVDVYLPAAELRSEEEALRHGPVRDDRAQLAQTLRSYARTLSGAEQVMVIDELDQGDQPQHVQAQQLPAGDEEHLRELTDRAGAAHAHAQALEVQVEQLRVEAARAAERAQLSRVRLLLEGTTPSAAAAARAAADERVAQVSEQARQARAQAQSLARQVEHVHNTHVERSERLRVLEPAAARQGLTRRGLHALDEQGLRDVEAARHAYQRSQRGQGWRQAARVDTGGPTRSGPRAPASGPGVPSVLPASQDGPRHERGRQR
ncbi:MobF family relaxase [Nocardiopsis dassonvillei]|uniref:MobF family relaxase n=1 Tax=Nocardiopsis dassonvillei TaxID=2014 RepID=UPI00340A5137